METSGGSGQPRSDSEQAPERAHRDATGTPANQDAPTDPTTDRPAAPAPTTANPTDRAQSPTASDADGETTDAATPADDAKAADNGKAAADSASAGNGSTADTGTTTGTGMTPKGTSAENGATSDTGTTAGNGKTAGNGEAPDPSATPPGTGTPADAGTATPPSDPPTASTPTDPVKAPAPADPEQAPAPADPEQAPAPDGRDEASAPADLTKAPAPADESERTATSSRPFAHSDAAPKPPERPKEPGGGILMGRPFGVPVYVAPSWFLVAALITWVFGGQLDRVLPELGALRYLVALFFAVAFYGSVLVHELAHTIAALRYKLPVRRIQLQFFGGVSEIEKESETPGREFVLAFVGPLLSLILAGVFYVALLAVEPGTVPGVLLAGLMISNLIVAAFNLLPGLPLDGGRMLRAVVWKITGKPMSGTIAAAWVGRALAVSVLIGLPLLTQSGLLGSAAEDSVGMDTVLDALLAAILAAIIWTGAGNSLRMARLREHLPELQARALTRRAVPVETDTPLSEALRRANEAGARALVVVDPDGEPLSLVREAAIVGVPEHRRPWVAVSGLAQDLTDGMRVSAELAGEELLDALRAAPATEYLVVEASGEIYGVLSAADVERAFVKAMARPS
ncbi:site-2 protease family protein [Streptomyces sp. AMCC400023]|uniref:site-2 protease family protein n=1 Tax=Streptomyces sp. AMCC400023 TaxID=2056258 RepID=UPI001F0241DD|nr:site-2 protease family protein [Streptomyces sp. AMCC400023]UJV44730.1 peptidase [Streptomyces sp. AMCC400023]